MSEYTPSTTEVRGAFVIANPDSAHSDAVANFDRWLASERARIWDEGVDRAFRSDLMREDSRSVKVLNPYRKDGDA